MNNSKQMRMENPLRIAELKPLETLIRIGLGENDAVCDIGAGSGIFTIPAAQITKNKVYALELDDEMLEVIGEKTRSLGLNNIELVKVSDDKFPIEDHTVDCTIIVTVFHEIENKQVFLSEIKRMLKNDGKIMVIEFYKRETPMGPPIDHRIEESEVKKDFSESGFTVAENFVLGDNFYCLIFQNAREI